MKKYIAIIALFLTLTSISVTACAGVLIDPVSLVVNYAMWSDMFGCEITGEPKSHTVAGHSFMIVDLVSIEYDPTTINTVNSSFELMDLKEENSSGQVLKFMAYIAAHEFGEPPEDYANFQTTKNKLLELPEIALDTLEKGLSQITTGKNLSFYSGENFDYSLYMNRGAGTICVLGTPKKSIAK